MGFSLLSDKCPRHFGTSEGGRERGREGGREGGRDSGTSTMQAGALPLFVCSNVLSVHLHHSRWLDEYCQKELKSPVSVCRLHMNVCMHALACMGVNVLGVCARACVCV